MLHITLIGDAITVGLYALCSPTHSPSILTWCAWLRPRVIASGDPRFTLQPALQPLPLACDTHSVSLSIRRRSGSPPATPKLPPPCSASAASPVSSLVPDPGRAFGHESSQLTCDLHLQACSAPEACSALVTAFLPPQRSSRCLSTNAAASPPGQCQILARLRTPRSCLSKTG